MPNLLEKKLKIEYGSDNHAVFGTMNKIGAMRGNKVTPKGRAIQKAMKKDMNQPVKRVPLGPSSA